MLRLSGQAKLRVAQPIDTILKFRKGEIIYEQGDLSGYWYEVISGTVRTCHFSSDGHRQLTGFFYTGDAFGMDPTHYFSSAEAVTAVQLRRCGGGYGQEDRSKDSEALERALISAQDCIFLLGRKTAAERVAAFLLATSRRMGRRGPLQLPMSRTDIADHLGLTIHTVSRTLSEFVRRHIIQLDGPHAIIILDNAALLRVVDSETEPPITKIGALAAHSNNSSSLFCRA